jgi:hypothetical protein
VFELHVFGYLPDFYFLDLSVVVYILFLLIGGWWFLWWGRKLYIASASSALGNFDLVGEV